ncbi:MAG: hypothetical protein LC099_08245 [Anaerolineales bacterium]|nr:hypothetical protein [Anaerolineales bacterium]
MQVTRIENLPPPPGILSSIKAGFDAVASHVELISFPFLLNLAIWLGPRLQMDSLFKSLEGDMATFWRMFNIPADQVRTMLTTYESLSQSVNLFQLTRTFPIGVPLLMLSAQPPYATPLGDASVWQVDEATLPLWFFAIIAVGWICGALYFRNVADAVQPKEAARVRVFAAIVQTALISTAGSFLFPILILPILLIVGLAAQISDAVANILVLLIALFSMWAIVPIFFWAHGVFLSRQNALTSFLSGLQLTRFTIPTSSLFVLTVFLFSYGLTYIWRLSPSASWVALFGIFGHSFVATALLAASFIYYYNMSAWVQAVLEKLRQGNAAKPA